MSPLSALVRIALRIKPGQGYTALEIDALIQRYQKGSTDEPVALRALLIQEELLQQQADDTYVRPTLTADHPAMVKLREEALTQQRTKK